MKQETSLRSKVKRIKLIFLLFLLSSSNSSGSSGGDETNLLTGGRASLDGRSLSDVLMVATSVGVLNGVHGNTSNLGPAVPLDLEIKTFYSMPYIKWIHPPNNYFLNKPFKMTYSRSREFSEDLIRILLVRFYSFIGSKREFQMNWRLQINVLNLQ